jgi:hypothetical protein
MIEMASSCWHSSAGGMAAHPHGSAGDFEVDFKGIYVYIYMPL